MQEFASEKGEFLEFSGFWRFLVKFILGVKGSIHSTLCFIWCRNLHRNFGLLRIFGHLPLFIPMLRIVQEFASEFQAFKDFRSFTYFNILQSPCRFLQQFCTLFRKLHLLPLSTHTLSMVQILASETPPSFFLYSFNSNPP